MAVRKYDDDDDDEAAMTSVHGELLYTSRQRGRCQATVATERRATKRPRIGMARSGLLIKAYARKKGAREHVPYVATVGTDPSGERGLCIQAISFRPMRNDSARVIC
jgi:hypothetical protein